MYNTHMKDLPLEAMMPTEEGINEWRQQMGDHLTQMEEREKAFFQKHLELVEIKTEKLKMRDKKSIEVIIYRPYSLKSKSAPALVHAHGGGAIAFSAKRSNPQMAVSAVNLNCVIFSVDYRLGPEHKCPKGQQDFVDSLIHIVIDCKKYGIDPKRICLSGISGGGWIVAGAMNMIIKENKPNIFKAIFIQTGMLSDETARVPEEELTEYERDWGMHPKVMTQIYRLLAKDFDNQTNDDQLYPGKVGSEILKKWPMTAIWTSEYDMYRRDNELFAARLKEVGKLADISIMNSCIHGYMVHAFDSEYTQEYLREEKEAFEALVE